MSDPRQAEDPLPLPEDFSTPPTVPPEEIRPAGRSGVPYRAAVWSPRRFSALMEHLAGRGRRALAEIDTGALLEAWNRTVAVFRDPSSRQRRALDPSLARLCRLSPDGLAAGLEAVLGGVAGTAAAALFAEAEAKGPAAPAPVVVLLAANLPALAVQPLLPALALGRPVLLKSPSAEPLFAPAFTAALARREPRLAEALAAVTWPGGDERLEAPLLAAAGRVLAYGERETLDDLQRRTAGKVFGYGPMTSLAAVGAGVPPEEVAGGLGRDVALFDQRGCLSVTAVFTGGDAGELAERLAAELAERADRWPPGPADAATAAAVQQIRAEAEMRGLHRPRLRPAGLPEDALAAGTVVVEPRPVFLPSPGLRTVRVHPLPELARLPRILAPWQGRIQGAALAGDDARALRPALARLGVSRTAEPGELQSPDASWHNGGVHPLAVLGG